MIKGNVSCTSSIITITNKDSLCCQLFSIFHFKIDSTELAFSEESGSMNILSFNFSGLKFIFILFSMKRSTLYRNKLSFIAFSLLSESLLVISLGNITCVNSLGSRNQDRSDLAIGFQVAKGLSCQSSIDLKLFYN